MNLTMKRTKSLMLLFFFLALSATFQSCSSLDSAVLLKAFGNIYPLGYYSVNLSIGMDPPKMFDLDIDTGSDLTWVQCDAPCTGCTKPPDQLYRPKEENVVRCSDPLCATLHWPELPSCEYSFDQCDYEIGYADQGSSRGVLVVDNFRIPLINGSIVDVRLAFGCGYDQLNPGPHPPPDTAGVLGLGKGKISILSQLRAHSLIRNATGICISGKGGGYLVLGDNPVPPAGVAWTKMSENSMDGHYKVGPADLLFDGQSTGLTGLQLIFDSGASYTYFSAPVYEVIVALIQRDLILESALEDMALPICWKGPFESVSDAKTYFKPLTLSFTNPKSVQLHTPPESYLIISDSKNVCLGILNGTENGLGDTNLIGENFMQDKLVVYDNELQLIKWVTGYCDKVVVPSM